MSAPKNSGDSGSSSRMASSAGFDAAVASSAGYSDADQGRIPVIRDRLDLIVAHRQND